MTAPAPLRTPLPACRRLPAAAGGVAAVPGAPGAAPFKREIITITTDVLKVDIDTAGGVVRRLELLKYKQTGHPGWFGGCFGLFEVLQAASRQHQNEVLFDEGADHAYLAQTGLVGGAGPAEPQHRLRRQARRAHDRRQQRGAAGARAGAGRRQADQDLHLPSAVRYVIDLRHDVTNVGAAPVAPSLYLQLLHDGNKPEGDTFFNSSFTGPTLYTPAEKYQKLDFGRSRRRAKTRKHADQVEQRLDRDFAALLRVRLCPAGRSTARDIYTKKVDTNRYAIGTVHPAGHRRAGRHRSATWPSCIPVRRTRSCWKASSPGLDLVKDYGFLTIIAKPIFWVMNQIHNVLGNWGWTIIAFTILIKLAFFPLSAAGYRSMAKIKVVTPKMQAIRERYKSDPAKMNQATMELYKTEKINPLGGCLPILVQMPVFIALYWVLQASVEFRGAPWMRLDPRPVAARSVCSSCRCCTRSRCTSRPS